MLALKEANYLGQVEYLSLNSGLITSITSYPDLAHAENLHYHNTLHLSIVLKGGNLEKRKQHDIERLPGTGIRKYKWLSVFKQKIYLLSHGVCC